MREHESQGLIESLKNYQPTDAEEEDCRDIILKFALSHDFPFDRANLDAHLTASAIVMDHAHEKILLGYHRKLSRWLQLGGHGDPCETSAEAVAAREALEESGIEGLKFHPAAPRPFDLDVHLIPEHRGIPAHNHLDIRFLLVAPSGAEPQCLEDEHHAVQWFDWDEAAKFDLDLSLRRALAKARGFVARSMNLHPKV